MKISDTKSFPLLLFLLLTATAVSPQVKTDPALWYNKIPCCYKVTTRKIPIQMIKAFMRTSNILCPLEAVIFKTKKNREICVDPKEKWVIKYLEKKPKTRRPRTLASGLRDSQA